MVGEHCRDRGKWVETGHCPVSTVTTEKYGHIVPTRFRSVKTGGVISGVRVYNSLQTKD